MCGIMIFLHYDLFFVLCKFIDTILTFCHEPQFDFYYSVVFVIFNFFSAAMSSYCKDRPGIYLH